MVKLEGKLLTDKIFTSVLSANTEFCNVDADWEVVEVKIVELYVAYVNKKV